MCIARELGKSHNGEGCCLVSLTLIVVAYYSEFVNHEQVDVFATELFVVIIFISDPTYFW